MNTLPIGFAQQLLTLEMQLEQQDESIELLAMISQMYKIAVDYYLQHDDSKAIYFQRKLNYVMVKSINRPSPKFNHLTSKIKNQMKHYQECQQTLIKSLVQNTQKAQQRFQQRLQADLNKQEQNLKNRMLQRVKSSGKLPLATINSNL